MGGKAFTEYQKEIAFDQYYVMGEGRDLKILAISLQDTPEFRERSPVHITVRKWSSENNWQERCKLRDIENSKKVQETTDKEVVNTKADYRKQIKEGLVNIKRERGYLTSAFGTAKKKLEDKKDKTLDVTSIRDLTDLSKAMQGMYREEQALMKLDLLMMGEADSRVEVKPDFLDLMLGRKQQAESE